MSYVTPCHRLPPILRPTLHRVEQKRTGGTAHQALRKLPHPSTPASRRLVTPRAGTPSATYLARPPPPDLDGTISVSAAPTSRLVKRNRRFPAGGVNVHSDVADTDAAASGGLLRARPTESIACSSPIHRNIRPASRHALQGRPPRPGQSSPT